jgi:hypothetical protein
VDSLERRVGDNDNNRDVGLLEQARVPLQHESRGFVVAFQIVLVSSDVNSIPESTLVLYDAMIALGGGVFRGVQQGIAEPLILFDDASVESPRFTLALPASKISAHAVIEAIRNKRQRYGNLKRRV